MGPVAIEAAWPDRSTPAPTDREAVENRRGFSAAGVGRFDTLDLPGFRGFLASFSDFQRFHDA
ncbi:MAG: hypothetical protein ACP5XB_22230 [Isosphaeraceae bacterium]